MFGKATEVLSYYIPRISTIAFIEVFAFFFLRLYKATIAEEKFYQNELTSRTARQTALEAALRFKEIGPTATVIANLSIVDPNKNAALPAAEAKSPDLRELGNLLEGAAKIISAAASKGKRHFLAALFWGCSGFKLDSWWLCGHGGLGWMKG